MNEKTAQPWLLKDGDEIVFEGTRSDCMSNFLLKPNDMAKNNGHIRLVKNPEFDWVEEDE